MIYRIIITNLAGKIYYLTSEDECPKTDAPVNLNSIEFLSNLNATHAHTFSSEELAQEVIKSLPYPYNEKTSVLAFPHANSAIVTNIFYRVAKKQYDKNILLWANVDKSFTQSITSETLAFKTQEQAETFIQSLVGLKKKFSYVVKIKDYGEPDYKFDAEFIINGKSIFDKSQLLGISKVI